MTQLIKRLVTTGLAAIVTATAILMASIAALDRGGTQADMLTLVAISIAICTATHLLPALSKRPVVWLLWVACLLGAMYGHMTFFTHAAIRAGEARAQASVHAQGFADQVDVAREALARIKSRPVATIARDLSWTKSERRRAALEEELAEAKRAARLQDGIVSATGAIGQVQAEAVADPVLSRLAVVTGSSEAGVSVAVGVSLAILVELLGAFLWWEALSGLQEDKDGAEIQQSLQSTTGQSDPLAGVGDPVATLRGAVESGLCRPTVASIRVFMACSQARALELRRALVA